MQLSGILHPPAPAEKKTYLNRPDLSLFSIPDKDRKVESPEEFFNSEEISLDNVTFNRDDIMDKIDSLAAGPDGIPAILLKNASIA